MQDVPQTPASRLEPARTACTRFHAMCFWDMRPDLVVTVADLPVIAERLRRHGGHEGWRIASVLCP
jgi:hypothetical protein